MAKASATGSTGNLVAGPSALSDFYIFNENNASLVSALLV